MQRLYDLIKKILLVFFIFFLHVIITNILPYPFNHINIIYLAIFYTIFLPAKNENLWLAIPMLFFLELFASTAFGLNFIAYFITLIFMGWMFANIFTSRSLPFLILYFATGLVVYRIGFYILEYFISYFISGGAGFNLQNILLNISLEVALTAGVMVLFHLPYATFNKKFNPRYLNSE